jgi:hypothetical protein
MASIATPASYQDMSAINRHSLHASIYMPQPQPVAPFEGIVDFTQTHRPTSHAQFGPYADVPFPHHASAPHRADGTEWKQSSFFSYRPNEVKHRKRTTRHQLKVLEETFRTTQKPDGNVRKALAAELDMTPRNVQVWFQNRRAKDKTLAKRAQKVTEDVQGRNSSLDAASPAVLLHDSEQLNDTFETFASPNNQYLAPAEPSFQVQYSGPTPSSSTSPVEATFPKLEAPTLVRAPQDIAQPQPFRAASSTSNSFSSLDVDDNSSRVMSSGIHAHGAYAVEAPSNALNYSRALFAPRNSLPHIHATQYQQDIQHQRSNSSPAFLRNVDTSSDLSLTTYASIHGVLYPQRLASSLSQQPAQSVYNSSFSASAPRVPNGPLPSSDFTFGTAHPSAETERDSEASFARYQIGSVSGSNTPSSLSGLSQYGSVASLVDNDFTSLPTHGFEDESSLPASWQNEQRRGSASHGVRPFPANRFGREFSPSSDPESDGSASAAYLTNNCAWAPTYPEESKPVVKSSVGYQQEAFGLDGYPEQDVAFPSYVPLMDSASYSSQAAANNVLGNQFALDASYGSDNRIPFGGYRPIATSGYQFA